MCYIRGGTAPGSQYVNPGCSDATEPRGDVALSLSHGLYFAGASQMWTGGVAFIRPTPDGQNTLARAYLITWQQFEEIVAQESCRAHAPIRFATLRAAGYCDVGHDMYDRLVYCSDRQGYPMVSFTTPRTYASYTAPVLPYVQRVAAGLMEAHGLSPRAAAAYLASVPGIRGAHGQRRLEALLQKQTAPASDAV